MAIEIVSADVAGNEGNGFSDLFSPGGDGVSADGRYVAFRSLATGLVAGDTNAASDVFVKDTLTGAITRVSTDAGGGQVNGASAAPAISADGRYVAFYSLATNLVAGDTNAIRDVFVKDTLTGTVTRVSTNTGGGTEGNGESDFPSISTDGRYVAFESNATNLVAGDTNGLQDIFVKDTVTGITTRVSTDTGGSQGTGGISERASISADGRYVAFTGFATNLVVGDTNGAQDVFVKDTVTGVTTRVSTDAGGSQGNNGSANPSISADGRYVAFNSGATNLVPGDGNLQSDVFIKDTLTGVTTRVSTTSGGGESNGLSTDPSISADGRYVAFYSNANNLVAGDFNGSFDVFVKDTLTGAIQRLSTDAAGTEGNSSSSGPAISADGRVVAFYSDASNLIGAGVDTNGQTDVFAASAPYAALLSGDYWGGIERANTPVYVTYSFPTSAPASHAGVAGISAFEAFSGAQQADTVAALNQWGTASGITFLEVPAGQGQINFALYAFSATGTGSGGMAFNPFGDWNYTTFTGEPNQAAFFSDSGDGVTDASGDVFINKTPLVGGVIPTGLLLHEIGHALGLKHVNPTFVGDTSHIVFSGTVTHDETLTIALDTSAQTVMSYNGAAPLVLGTLDIQAIQHIYGTNAQDGTQVASSSWNAGTFELTQTGYDFVSALSPGDDIIRGVSVRDIMAGGSGNDRLFGLGGNDDLSGGDGLDQLWGGFGNDTMTGGADVDTFFIALFEDAAGQADTITDFNVAQDIIDLQLQGPVSFVGPASYQAVEDWLIRTTGTGNTGPGNAQLLAVWNSNLQTVTLTGVAADLSSGSLVSALTAANFVTPSFGARTTTGTGGNDMLFGSLSGDTLSGGGGSDLLVGDDGVDTLNGDAGLDLLDGGAGADVLNGGADQDAVYYNRRVDFALVAGVATAVGTTQVGDESIGDSFNSIEYLRGSKFNDTITLDTSIDTLSGFAGDDVLTGSTDVNNLQGGDGNDTITTGGGNDVVLGQAGNDTVTFTGSYTQGHAWGDGGQFGGPAGNDTLNGGAGVDLLFGEGGNDILNGGDLTDHLYGGAGADTINGQGGNDHFWDAEGAVDGDTYTGGSGVNILHYSTSGTFDFSAVGADSYDAGVIWVTFDGGAATATGLASIDRFSGSAFADTFNGGGENDWIVGGAGGDTLNGDAGNDRLQGGADADTFDGGLGIDTLEGQGGADTFVFRNIGNFVDFDAVLDFSSAEGDKLAFLASDFGPAGAGALPADRFLSGAGVGTPTTAEETLIYDTSNGYLYYDVNGSAAGGQTLAAIITGAPTLASSDFLLL